MPRMDITEMAFAKVYPLLVAKAEKKGRTRDEVDQVTAWLTGYTPEELAGLAQSDTSYGDFSRNAPAMNPDRALITGKICGIRVEEIGPGTARAVMTLEPRHLNPVGVPHGGVYFSLADTACGSAMASHGYYAVTVNASYNFLRSAKLGDHLVAEARETKPGRTLCFYEVEIRDQAGTLLGNGSFTFYKLDREIPL